MSIVWRRKLLEAITLMQRGFTMKSHTRKSRGRQIATIAVHSSISTAFALNRNPKSSKWARTAAAKKRTKAAAFLNRSQHPPFLFSSRQSTKPTQRISTKVPATETERWNSNCATIEIAEKTSRLNTCMSKFSAFRGLGRFLPSEKKRPTTLLCLWRI